MFIALIVLQVILLIASAFVIGLYVGKGKIIVNKKLSKEANDIIIKNELEREKQLEAIENQHKEMMSFDDEEV